MLKFLPLTLVPLIIYNAIVFGMVAPEAGGDIWDTLFLQVDMMSGQTWSLTWGDLLLLAGLGCLFIEMIKATLIGAGSVPDHLFSMVVFLIYLIEFLLVVAAGHSVFFILMAMAIIDVLAGFTIALRAARRDIAFSGGFPGSPD